MDALKAVSAAEEDTVAVVVVFATTTMTSSPLKAVSATWMMRIWSSSRTMTTT
jgi:hypothetical protein